MSDLITNAFNEIDPRNEKFVEKNTDIVEEIYALMEQNGINSQKELSKLLEKKESEVSKLLSGIQNMTLRSITNLEVALGQDIILTSSRAKEKFEQVSYMVCYKNPVVNDFKNKAVETKGYYFDEPKTIQLKIA